MELQEIVKHVDHTVLSPTATEADIVECVEDAVAFGCACAMIPPCFVPFAVKQANGRVPVATVIGFPHGNSTTRAKCAEAFDAVGNGASEIDMVANISWIKEGKWDAVRDDIAAVRESCAGKPLKVIIETCLLDDEEKIEMCSVCAEAGADWIKTSTGFSQSGATPHDAKLLCANAPEGLKVKAAGGIASLADAEQYLAMGVDRLGTSRLVKIAKEAM